MNHKMAMNRFIIKSGTKTNALINEINISQQKFINKLDLDQSDIVQINNLIVHSFQKLNTLPLIVMCFTISDSMVYHIRNKDQIPFLFENSYIVSKKALSIDDLVIDIYKRISDDIFESIMKIIRYITIERELHLIISKEDIQYDLSTNSLIWRKGTKATIYTLYIDWFQSKCINKSK
jgi:hypothetical protein